MANHSRIEINSDIMIGKPVIRGTRVPVELILRKLSEGATEADLLDAYPRLSREDIKAALAYAADTAGVILLRWEAYQAFRDTHDLAKLNIGPEVFEDIRDRSAGREVNW